MFRLYDTHGFPADITNIVAKERGWSVDMERFEQLMEEQKKSLYQHHLQMPPCS